MILTVRSILFRELLQFLNWYNYDVIRISFWCWHILVEGIWLDRWPHQPVRLSTLQSFVRHRHARLDCNFFGSWLQIAFVHSVCPFTFRLWSNGRLLGVLVARLEAILGYSKLYVESRIPVLLLRLNQRRHLGLWSLFPSSRFQSLYFSSSISSIYSRHTLNLL